MDAAVGLDIPAFATDRYLVQRRRASNRNLAELLGQSFRILHGYHVHATGEHQERGWSMTEQVPKDLTEAEVVDRLEVGRPEDEGDGSSEVDRWDDEGGHDRAG